MWPFSRNQARSASPSVRCGGITATWSTEWGWWEFSHDGVDFTLSETPCFNANLVEQLGCVDRWLRVCDQTIDAEIKQHLTGGANWTGEKRLVGVDVSWLVDKQQIDAAFAHEGWGDLGVNIVITNGEVTGSYAGD